MGNTSSLVKRKYNNKVYKQVKVELKKELVEQWENAIKDDGITKAEFIRRAITEYLKTKAD